MDSEAPVVTVAGEQTVANRIAASHETMRKI
jgi:hypothetical protein